jgi:hypothetical protein
MLGKVVLSLTRHIDRPASRRIAPGSGNIELGES